MREKKSLQTDLYGKRIEKKKYIILSRKGVDSRSGRIYSPLNGTTGEYAFLFIEEKADPTNKGFPYRKIPVKFLDYNNAYEILLYNRRENMKVAHVDPDLVNFRPEIKDWKACFGQTNGAGGHLKNLKVDKNPKGSIFLFFSRFKPWKNTENDLKEGYYIYGWLQVKEVIIPNSSNIKTHPLNYHSHFSLEYIKKKKHNNMVFVATNKLENTDIPGAGMFKRLSNEVRLSYYEDSDLLTWCLPLYTMNSFTRLQNYRKIDEDNCLVNWPRTFSQEAICPCNLEAKNENLDKIHDWAISMIKTGINKGGGIKENHV